MSKAMNAVVRGRVQGVGFRISARDEAVRLGLCGWVRNAPDGSVEVRAEGDAAGLEAFLAWLHRGPSPARVDRVEVTWSTAGNAGSDFRITA